MSINIDVDDDDDAAFDQFDVDVEGGRGYRRIGERESVGERVERVLGKMYAFAARLKLGTLFKVVAGLATAILFVVVFAASFRDAGAGTGDEKGSQTHDPLLPSTGDKPSELPPLTLDALFGGDLSLREGTFKFIDVELPAVPQDGETTEQPDVSERDNSDDVAQEEKEEKEKNHSNNENPSDEGLFLSLEGSNCYIKKAQDPSFTFHLIDLKALTFQSVPLNPSLVDVTKDLTKIIVVSDVKPQWRHSSRGHYWLVDRATLAVEPIHSTDNAPQDLYYARFTPNGDALYYNYNGNLFLYTLEKGKTVQITKDGDNVAVFNGKPDWVYEEEVLGSASALWWSPNGNQFAFIRWDQSNVPVYNLEFFKYDKYPQVEQLRYPKPGYPNPTVSLHVYNVEKSKSTTVKQPWEVSQEIQQLGTDFIIYQVAWLNDEQLVFKTTDRSSRSVHFNAYDVKSKTSSLVRALDTASYGGWYKNNGDIYVVPNNRGYVDTLVVDGHDHLAYYKSLDDSAPTMLSSGDWDVVDGVLGSNGNEIFFVGTHGNALQRQVYKSSLDTLTLTALTDIDAIHSYSLTLSSSGNWGVLKYNGPDLPSQKMINLNDYVSDPSYYSGQPELSNSHDLSEKLQTLAVPLKTYLTIDVGEGILLDAVEVKPVNFNPAQSYPLLVSVYGGPGSQKVSATFSYGFEEIVASSLNAVVLYIDPRGTGGRGWDYQSWAKYHIGMWEPKDITKATEKYANDNEYVNIDKIAIWGWSYGGFTTLKTLEYDAGRVFSYGMAVAPVTNWALYDSIYTERYMGLPKDNLNGYNDAMITKYTNFAKVKRFLIIHGSGDDNVHFQNTLQLLNSFDINNVENYDMHVYPDSDHSIHYDNANPMVYSRLFHWLQRAFEK